MTQIRIIMLSRIFTSTLILANIYSLYSTNLKLFDIMKQNHADILKWIKADIRKSVIGKHIL